MYFVDKQTFNIVFIDLDGTLLNNNKEIGLADYETLNYLGKIGVVRVFATGRNIYSVKKVISDDCPVDYLVFSSGAGIMDWKSKRIISDFSLTNREVSGIIEKLKELKLNFCIQYPIPENHHYYYHQENNLVSDFSRRNDIYKNFSYPLNGNYPLEFASQFLIILNDETEIQAITDKIEGFKIIRATSPIDGKSVWLEIFNKNASKASGAKYLCDVLNIGYDKTIAIGNDYNDLDMLDWASHSFVVSNAPDEIKDKYKQCCDNQNNPLSDVINKITY